MGNSSLDEMSSYIKLMHKAEIRPALFKPFLGKITVEIAIGLLHSSNLDRKQRYFLRQFRFKICCQCPTGSFNPFINVAIIEIIALKGALLFARSQQKIINATCLFTKLILLWQ